MPRLIEVQDVAAPAPHLTAQTGDVLLFRAAGARLLSGSGVLEPLGPFVTAVLAGTGEVLTPEGPPNTVLVRANGPGRAQLEVISGDPFHNPQTVTWTVSVG